MQFLRGYKLHLGGFTCIFLALGGIAQQLSDEVEPDWNRAAMDFAVGVSILGAAFKTNDKPAK